MTDKMIILHIAQLPPAGPLTSAVYERRTLPLPEIRDRECLLRVIYLSVDAGSRGMLDQASPYVRKLKAGDVAGGSGCVAEVIASRHPEYPRGTFVATMFASWQSHLVVAPDKMGPLLYTVDPALAPLSAYVGILGVTGFTAYAGVFLTVPLKAGETAVISAASGAVGSAAGQFAKIAGARVIGITGGTDKFEYLKSLGFDACVDYRTDLSGALRAACPDGIDFYFENVGGEVQRAVFALMRDFGRMAFCGQIAQYSGEGEPSGPNLMNVVLKRLTLKGFLCLPDSQDHYAEFFTRACEWYRSGRLRQHTAITEGLENAHEAVNALISGRHLGKQVIRVARDPTR
ncbi:MAG: NADP-dependent oxidoreductase [Steroidobacteraceae bacterium]